MIEAINEVHGARLVESDDDANFYLAQHVYQLKLSPAFEKLGRLSPERIAAGKQEAAEQDRKLKAAIANHLKQAASSGTLKLRPRFQEVIRDPRFGQNKLFLTANWDCLLEREIDNPKLVVHLHGDVSNPDNLFLPSEITPEGYRTNEQHSAMGKSVSTLWQAVANAESICIFGLSLSPLDVEVAYTIGVGIKDKPDLKRRITIFALEGHTELIARRLTLISGGNTNLKFAHEPQPRG